jgi:hypothetical protein
MDDDGADRSRPVLLTALALVVVAAGGWWWTANDPATGGKLSAVASAPAPAGDRLLAGSGLPWSAGAAAAAAAAVADRDAAGRAERAAVDGGAALRRSVVVLDPETGAVVADGSGPGAGIVLHVPPGRRAGPVATVWRERTVLGRGNRELTRMARPEPGARFLLQYTCRGEGELTVSVGNAEPVRRLSTRQLCPADLVTTELVATGGVLRVRMVNLGAAEVRVFAQLVQLD